MRSKLPTQNYLEQAEQLSPEDTERLMARMRGRFSRRLEDRKLSAQQAIALQLEYEDEELAEWRERMAELQTRLDAEPRDSASGGQFEPILRSLNS